MTVNGHTSVLTLSVHEREVTALVTIQAWTSSPAVRRTAVILSHLGEHALTWTALGLLGAVRDPAKRRPWLRATATVVGAHAVCIVISIIPFVIAVLKYSVNVDSGAAGEPEEVVLHDRMAGARGCLGDLPDGLGVPLADPA